MRATCESGSVDRNLSIWCDYAYPAKHSGIATIEALLPNHTGFSTWNTAGAGTIIPYGLMDATLRYLNSTSCASATDGKTRGVFDTKILELNVELKNVIYMGLAEWARDIDVDFLEVTDSNNEAGVSVLAASIVQAHLVMLGPIIPIGTMQ
jgi:hypothetical protein